MKKVLFFFFLITFKANLLLAQSTDKILINRADSFYNTSNFKEAAETFEEALESNSGNVKFTDRYNAACAYALARDSAKAFYHLLFLAESPNVKYKSYFQITLDPDLTFLHGSPQWYKIIALVKANKEENEKDLNKELVAILDTLYYEDQHFRKEIKSIENKFGLKSQELKEHWKLINEKDSLNLIKIDTFLARNGWLGADIIGYRGNSTIFLVIQHSPLEVQEKYLPLMREAVKKGNARPTSLALLEDRIAIRKGGKQIYGSQIGRDIKTGKYYVLPLIEPENVDRRRAEVGLKPMNDYLSYWNISWDLERHLETMEKLNKKEE